MKIKISQLRRIIKEEIARFDPKSTVDLSIRDRRPAENISLTSSAVFDKFEAGNATLATLAKALGVKNVNEITHELLADAGLELAPDGVNVTRIGEPAGGELPAGPQGPIRRSKHRPVIIPPIK